FGVDSGALHSGRADVWPARPREAESPACHGFFLVWRSPTAAVFPEIPSRCRNLWSRRFLSHAVDSVCHAGVDADPWESGGGQHCGRALSIAQHLLCCLRLPWWLVIRPRSAAPRRPRGGLRTRRCNGAPSCFRSEERSVAGGSFRG